MIDDSSELRQVLENTPLAGREVLELAIPEHPGAAFAVEVDGGAFLPFWQAARDLLAQTGRWPVFVVGWGGGRSGWRASFEEYGIFGRDPFRYEWLQDENRDVSPAALVQRAADVDVDAQLEQLAARSLAYQSLEDVIQEALDGLDPQTGSGAEQLEELRAAGTAAGLGSFQRQLLDWQIDHAADEETAPNDGYLSWHPFSEPAALLLLPTEKSWEALAYLHFYGAETAGSEVSIALLRRWAEEYGAELVGHLGTMLYFTVESPPDSPRAAAKLAWEQETFAQCTTILPGVPLLHHARVLAGRDRWFLHERP